jgi:hypothetical protein
MNLGKSGKLWGKHWKSSQNLGNVPKIQKKSAIFRSPVPTARAASVNARAGRRSSGAAAAGSRRGGSRCRKCTAKTRAWPSGCGSIKVDALLKHGTECDGDGFLLCGEPAVQANALGTQEFLNDSFYLVICRK